MRHRQDLNFVLRPAKMLGLAAMLSLSAASIPALSSDACAQEQDENTRVMWNVKYADGVSKSTQNEAQSTLLSTLSRGRERHFATPSIITQKIKSEGLQIPSCFEDGGPCASGPAFLLDVHQVDVYVDALFDKKGDEWIIELKLSRRLSSVPTTITQSGKNLSTLLNNIVGSLFTLESSIDITSTLPDVEVWLNQKLIGTTPLSMKITEGQQKLVFKKNGYVQDSWDFVAKKGVIHSHEVTLKPETTPFVVLASDENASIWVDGQEWAKPGESRDILPGNHNIRIESENYHDYEQELTIYPGGQQTMQVSLLPNSRDPYDVRAEGIKRYRFAASVGYHFGLQKFNMGHNSIVVKRGDRSMPQTVYPGGAKGNANEKFADTSFHGISMALNYEDEFWGVTIARLDLMGSAIEDYFGLYTNGGEYGPEIWTSTTTPFDRVAYADGATLIGFYPAQLKAHYNIWVMQLEAVAGVGLSWTKLDAVLEDKEENGYSQKMSWDRTQFSMNFDFDIKYFFSEETFAMLAYGFQIDMGGKRDTTFRHGMTLAVGLQIPLLMRDKKLNDALDNGILLNDETAENQQDQTNDDAQTRSDEEQNDADNTNLDDNDVDVTDAPVVIDEDEENSDGF